MPAEIVTLHRLPPVVRLHRFIAADGRGYPRFQVVVVRPDDTRMPQTPLIDNLFNALPVGREIAASIGCAFDPGPVTTGTWGGSEEAEPPGAA